MQPDEIPQLPEIHPRKYEYEEQDVAIDQFKKANRKLMAYENEEGKFCFLFNKLDEIFYAEFVAVLSRNEKRYEDIYTFLKFCLEGVRLLKQCSKKALADAVRIEKYLKYSNRDS